MSDNRNCTVYGCTNTAKKGKEQGKVLKFYSYPGRPWESYRREAWIKFARRINRDGSPWTPSKYSRICSEHFEGGLKSEHPQHPNYLPTIFQPQKLTESHRQKTARFDRFMQRRAKLSESDNTDYSSTDNIHGPREAAIQLTKDKATQVEPGMIDATLHNILPYNPFRKPTFLGYASLQDNNQALLDLTGVSKPVFEMMLKVLPKVSANVNALCLEDRLLLTLMKLKVGSAMTFNALGVLFSTNDRTISRAFHFVINCLYASTSSWIFFPSKEAIRDTMPNAFKEEYQSCRVIIDCFEMKTEAPSKIAERIHLYSNYKGCFTVKFIIGIAPCGFISFLSKGYGGRATDSFITNDCGIIDLLQAGDTIMADKGFPQINIQEDVVLVMPPFSKGKSYQFTDKEVDQTYKVASLRIHVERAIARIKQFKILSTTIPMSILPIIDKIVHICCVLANLGTPLIKT